MAIQATKHPPGCEAFVFMAAAMNALLECKIAELTEAQQVRRDWRAGAITLAARGAAYVAAGVGGALAVLWRMT